MTPAAAAERVTAEAIDGEGQGSDTMDIKIGLADSPRELTIKLPEGQEDIIATVEQAISGGQATLKVEDDKGRVYLIRTDRIVYVEQGSAAARSVGFMR